MILFDKDKFNAVKKIENEFRKIASEDFASEIERFDEGFLLKMSAGDFLLSEKELKMISDCDEISISPSFSGEKVTLLLYVGTNAPSN